MKLDNLIDALVKDLDADKTHIPRLFQLLYVRTETEKDVYKIKFLCAYDLKPVKCKKKGGDNEIKVDSDLRAKLYPALCVASTLLKVSHEATHKF